MAVNNNNNNIIVWIEENLISHKSITLMVNDYIARTPDQH